MRLLARALSLDSDPLPSVNFPKLARHMVYPVGFPSFLRSPATDQVKIKSVSASNRRMFPENSIESIVLWRTCVLRPLRLATRNDERGSQQRE